MERKRVTWAAAAAWSALALGCSTRAQVRDAAGDAGILRSYAGPFDQVRKAALTALAESSLPVSEEWWLDRTRWSVLAAPARSFAMQRVLRIVVEDHPTDCRVWTLVQNKPDVVDVAAAEELQVRIARALGVESRPERAPPAAAGEREERYRSPLGPCFERTARACRARGYVILREEDGDAALRTITAEKKPSCRLFAALYRHSESVTRVVVEVRGGAPGENQEEASGIHEDLLKELQTEK
jgi:hypothetical protein